MPAYGEGGIHQGVFGPITGMGRKRPAKVEQAAFDLDAANGDALPGRNPLGVARSFCRCGLRKGLVRRLARTAWRPAEAFERREGRALLGARLTPSAFSPPPN